MVTLSPYFSVFILFDITIFIINPYRSIERATQYEAQRTGQKENSRDKGYKLKVK